MKLLVGLMERVPTGPKAVTFPTLSCRSETVALACLVWDSPALRAANPQSEHRVR